MVRYMNTEKRHEIKRGRVCVCVVVEWYEQRKGMVRDVEL